jgi:hypothetical protein
LKIPPSDVKTSDATGDALGTADIPGTGINSSSGSNSAFMMRVSSSADNGSAYWGSARPSSAGELSAALRRSTVDDSGVASGTKCHGDTSNAPSTSSDSKGIAAANSSNVQGGSSSIAMFVDATHSGDSSGTLEKFQIQTSNSAAALVAAAPAATNSSVSQPLATPALGVALAATLARPAVHRFSLAVSTPRTNPAGSLTAAMLIPSPASAMTPARKSDWSNVQTISSSIKGGSSPQGATAVSASMLTAAPLQAFSSAPTAAAATAAAVVSSGTQDLQDSPRCSMAVPDQESAPTTMLVTRVSDEWAEITEKTVQQFRGAQGTTPPSSGWPATVFPGNMLEVVAEQQQNQPPQLAEGGQAKVYPITGKVLVPGTPPRLVPGVVRVVEKVTADFAVSHYDSVQIIAGTAPGVLPYLGMVWSPQSVGSDTVTNSSNSSSRTRASGAGSSSYKVISSASAGRVAAGAMEGTAYFFMEECATDLYRVHTEHDKIRSADARMAVFTPTTGAMHILAALLSAVRLTEEGAKVVLGDIKMHNMLLSKTGAIRVTDVG